MHAGKLIRSLVWPLLGLTTTAWAKDELPKTAPFAHYEPMLKRSPFAVATAGGPLGGKPDFAKDLYVANAAHSPAGDFVTIASTTDKNLKEYLSTRDTINGYSISSIQWSEKVGETKVTVAKDGQFATLTFNEALLSQAIQNPTPQVPPGQQVPGRPGVNSRPQGNAQIPVQRPVAVPQIPTPPPHIRPTIRRGAANQVAPQPQQPNVDPAEEVDDGEF